LLCILRGRKRVLLCCAAERSLLEDRELALVF
jgi:hypothetical protein